ncbi:MAG: COP23 domain-containing protein, partial [Prochlorothrix sp.]|nr:COP23 domain-containing protein [Prochlorothrix sp.]
QGLLEELRPGFYGEALRSWQESGNQDGFLLRGEALEQAEGWAKGKRLSEEDEEFLRLSREGMVREMQQRLAAEEEAKVILQNAHDHAELQLAKAQQDVDRATQETDRLRQLGVRVSTITLAIAAVAVAITVYTLQEAQQVRRLADEAEEERLTSVQQQQATLAELEQSLADLEKVQQDAAFREQEAELKVSTARSERDRVAAEKVQEEALREQIQIDLEQAQIDLTATESRSRDLIQDRAGLEAAIQANQEQLQRLQAQVQAAQNEKLTIEEDLATTRSSVNTDLDTIIKLFDRIIIGMELFPRRQEIDPVAKSIILAYEQIYSARSKVVTEQEGSTGLDLNSRSSSSDVEINFECLRNVEGTPTTYVRYYSSEGVFNRAVIQWKSETYNEFGYSPVRNCLIVSRRFHYFYSLGKLSNVGARYHNDNNVVCILSTDDQTCEDVLFQVEPEESANAILQQIFSIVGGSDIPAVTL